ncbi:hypothetical protein RB2501_14019 [Robiginitalea biformata HTCC2501]|uniref:Uncharacterized protein n=2 Tax=Robiginitalea TaxID=252306 RepID=A4CKQ1_ROBBH|nr:hypothetical protein RB2501_14019 [Robiginitalea biformata HTCC2501]
MTSPKEKISWQEIIVGIFSNITGGMSRPWKIVWFFLVTIVLLAVGTTYLLQDALMEAYQKRPLSEEAARVQAENERRIAFINDSIRQEEEKRKAAAAFNARREIETHALNTKYSMEHCIGVNYYSIHNGGETITVDGKWELEVYLSTEPYLEVDFPDNEDDGGDIRGPKNTIWRGWAWLNNEALQSEIPVYIPDVSKFPGLYVGRAKPYLEQAGIKSTVVMLVENQGTDFLFVSFNFDVINPHEVNGGIAMLSRKMYDFQRFVKERI